MRASPTTSSFDLQLPGIAMHLRTCHLERFLRVLSVITLVGIGLYVEQRWPQAGMAAGAAPAEEPAAKWLGAVSCASSACHNGNGPQGSKGSEYTTWVGYDKHHQAYTVLLEPRSQTIETNYRHPKAGEAAHAENDKLCLSCHAPTASEDVAAVTKNDGVGCEACHGPAGQWVATHYLPEWKDKNAQLGMKETKKLTARALMCAECHVGAGERQVDHDLIAAGHPRLRFEFGAYHATMAKHWSDQDEKSARPGFEARVWALGQIQSAEMALKLLASRANDKTRAWPEFAEYECFACHHDLQAKSWRQEQASAQKTPGLLPWGTWYFSEVARAAGMDDSEFQSIREAMKKPQPDRETVAKLAHETAERLHKKLQGFDNHAYGLASLRKLQSDLPSQPERLADPSWDAAVQLYLARAAIAAALDEAKTPLDQSELAALKGFRVRLEFPQGYDSPRGFDPYPADQTHK